MAKKKKSGKKKMIITKEDQRLMDAKARRDALKEEGLLNISTHKVHKSDKDYNRNSKHKKKIDPDDDIVK